MKRTFLIPLLSALIGGGIVVAVVAAAGGLGSTQKVVNEYQTTPAVATGKPSNATLEKAGSVLTPHQIYEDAAPGVAYVTSTVVSQSSSPFNIFGGESTKQEGTATGSGIVINRNGTILTNWHVVENAIKVTVSLENNKTVEAHVVGKDPSNDLAVLRIPTEGLKLHPLTLGNSSTVQVGDPAYAIGNPFDLDRTLTTGVISALQRHLTAPNGFTIYNVLQTDAPINPGNSGGPLLNSVGQVIGINSQIETGGEGDDGSVGIGFAVPINTAKAELPELEKGGTVRGAYLGVATVTIDGSLAALNLPTKSGALVEEVEAGTPAQKAGIRGGDLTSETSGHKVSLGGDIIIGVNGKKVTSSEDLGNDIAAEKAGDTITLELLRANGNGGYEKKTLKVTLTSRPNTLADAHEIPEG